MNGLAEPDCVPEEIRTDGAILPTRWGVFHLFRGSAKRINRIEQNVDQAPSKVKGGWPMNQPTPPVFLMVPKPGFEPGQAYTH